MGDTVETREVVVRWRDDGVAAGYRGVSAAGDQAAGATRRVGEAGSAAAQKLGQGTRDAQHWITQLSGAITEGHAKTLRAFREEDAARRTATEAAKRQAQEERDAEKQKQNAIRESIRLRQAQGQGFLSGMGLGGGQLSGLAGGLGQLTGAMESGGGFGFIGGAAVAAGALVAQGIGTVAVASVRILAAEAAFASKAVLGIGAAGVAAGSALLYASVSAAKERDKQIRGLTAILGSPGAAQAEFGQLRDIARIPGIDLGTALGGAVQMKAVGIELGQVNRLLREFANLNALIGGQPEVISRVALQFSQMAGKGKASGEEIRALANDLPPLMGALKQAFGTTNSEDINKMGLSFDQFTERLLAAMATMPRATGGINNGLVNLKMAWDEFLVTAGKPFLGEGSIRLLEALGKALEGVTPYVQALSEQLASRIPGIAAALEKMVTPEAIKALVARLTAMGTSWELWARGMQSAAADLVEGVGKALGFIIGNFVDFNRALLGVASATGVIMLGLADAVSFGTQHDKLMAIAKTMAAAHAVALKSLSALDATGFGGLGGGVEARAKTAADAIRGLSTAHSSFADLMSTVTTKADEFTAALGRQAAAVEGVSGAMDSQAEAARKLAELQTGAAGFASGMAGSRAATSAQARQDVLAWLPAMRGAAAGAREGTLSPAQAIGRLNPTQATEDRLQFLKDELDYYKRFKDYAPGAQQAIEGLEQQIELMTTRLGAFKDAWREQTQDVVTAQEAQKRWNEQVRKSGQLRTESMTERRQKGMGLDEALTSQVIGNLGAGNETILAQARLMSEQEVITSAVYGAARDTGTVVAEAMAMFPAIVRGIVDDELSRTARGLS